MQTLFNMKFKTEKGNKKRLDLFLMEKISKSRSYIQNLIKEGKVLVDSNIKTSGYIVKEGQEVIIDLQGEAEEQYQSENNLKFLLEDEDIIVLEKPADLVVYSEKKGPSLRNILKDKIKIEDSLRGGIVHRLDRDTSGLMVVAKNSKAEANLKDQFKNRVVEKGYLALVYGHVVPKTGEINIPIERAKNLRTKRSVGEEGKAAQTKYEVAEYIAHEGADFTLLDIKLITGRTHQIRVHFEAIGFPLVGDMDYNDKKFQRINEGLGAKRQFLHSYKLGFKHPKTEEWITFKSLLPKDLANVLKKVRS